MFSETTQGLGLCVHVQPPLRVMDGLAPPTLTSTLLCPMLQAVPSPTTSPHPSSTRGVLKLEYTGAYN